VYLTSPLLRNTKGTVSLEFTAGQSTCPHVRVLLPQGTPTLTILALKCYTHRSQLMCSTLFFSVFRMYFIFESCTFNLRALFYCSFRIGLPSTPEQDSFVLISSLLKSFLHFLLNTKTSPEALILILDKGSSGSVLCDLSASFSLPLPNYL
jgi:hypothetical protein